MHIFAFFRNQHIVKTSEGKLHLPKARKTGTTIVGLVYKDGVVLGADTRATEVCLSTRVQIYQESSKQLL